MIKQFNCWQKYRFKELSRRQFIRCPLVIGLKLELWMLCLVPLNCLVFSPHIAHLCT